MNSNEGLWLSLFNTSGPGVAVETSLSYDWWWYPTTKTTYERLAANRTTYRTFYTGNFTSVSPEPWMGAYHGSELPLLFVTYELNGETSAFETELSETMQDAYVAFASDLGAGLDSVGWTAYESVWSSKEICC